MSALALIPSFAPAAVSNAAAGLPAEPLGPGSALAFAGPAWPAAPAPLLTSYTWTGGGGGNLRWDFSGNWNVPGGFPSTCNDDAVIPAISGGYDIVLVTETIDDLTIGGDLDLTAVSGDNTLTVDSLTIVGGVVTFGNGTRIDTVSTCEP